MPILRLGVLCGAERQEYKGEMGKLYKSPSHPFIFEFRLNGAESSLRAGLPMLLQPSIFSTEVISDLA